MNKESKKKQLKDIMAEIQDMAIEHIDDLHENDKTRAIEILKMAIEIFEEHSEEGE